MYVEQTHKRGPLICQNQKGLRIVNVAYNIIITAMFSSWEEQSYFLYRIRRGCLLFSPSISLGHRNHLRNRASVIACVFIIVCFDLPSYSQAAWFCLVRVISLWCPSRPDLGVSASPLARWVSSHICRMDCRRRTVDSRPAFRRWVHLKTQKRTTFILILYDTC